MRDASSVAHSTPTPDIVRIQLEASLPRKLCLNVPMQTLSIKLPVHAGGPKVFWPGEGVEVGVDPYRTSVTFTAPTLTAKTMMAVEELTMELQEDSVVTLAPFFSTVFGDAVSQEENQQLFMSSTPFTGILSSSTAASSGVTSVYLGGGSTSGKTHFSAVQFPDIVNLMYSIHQSLIGRGTFVCNALAFQYLHGLRDLNGHPIFQTAWTNLPTAQPFPDQVAGMAGVLMGRPVYLTNTLPGTSAVNTAMIVYGAFNYFAFGDRKQLTVEWSDQVFWFPLIQGWCNELRRATIPSQALL